MLGFTASAVAFYRFAPGLPTTAAPAPTPTATQPAPSHSPTPSAAPTAEKPRSPVEPRSGDKLPSGPGTTRPGILLIATPASDGTFDVSEVARFPEPISGLTVRPPDIAALGGLFRRSNAVAKQVQVSAGDQPVVVPDGRVRHATKLEFAERTDRVELRYRLTGVTKRTFPSRANRALAGIGPLIATGPRDFPVAIIVPGRSVRNLTCPHLRLAERACAAGGPSRLRVDRPLPMRDARIQVQLDLPRPQ